MQFVLLNFVKSSYSERYAQATRASRPFAPLPNETISREIRTSLTQQKMPCQFHLVETWPMNKERVTASRSPFSRKMKRYSCTKCYCALNWFLHNDQNIARLFEITTRKQQSSTTCCCYHSSGNFLHKNLIDFQQDPVGLRMFICCWRKNIAAWTTNHVSFEQVAVSKVTLEWQSDCVNKFARWHLSLRDRWSRCVIKLGRSVERFRNSR